MEIAGVCGKTSKRPLARITLKPIRAYLNSGSNRQSVPQGSDKQEKNPWCSMQTVVIRDPHDSAK
jgi:hypothetical protein